MKTLIGIFLILVSCLQDKDEPKINPLIGCWKLAAVVNDIFCNGNLCLMAADFSFNITCPSLSQTPQYSEYGTWQIITGSNYMFTPQSCTEMVGEVSGPIPCDPPWTAGLSVNQNVLTVTLDGELLQYIRKD
ncbi:MAG: hypothetical protein V3U15_05400 [Nitrospinota bacterium]